jgi:hypothetical protein
VELHRFHWLQPRSTASTAPRNILSSHQASSLITSLEAHLETGSSRLKDITVVLSHATGNEAVQFMVSNSQKTTHGKNRGYGDQIKQLGGHLSGQSIQKVSGDFLQMSTQQTCQQSSCKQALD